MSKGKVIDKFREHFELPREKEALTILSLALSVLAAISIALNFSFLTSLIALFSGLVTQALPTLVEGRKAAKDRKSELKKSEKIISRFDKRIRNDFEIEEKLLKENIDRSKLREKIADETEFNVEKAYPKIADSYLSGNVSQAREKTILILALCREFEIKESSNESIHNLKDQIRVEIENSGIRIQEENLDEPAAFLLGTYESSRSTIEGKKEGKLVFSSNFTGNKREITYEFLEKYLPLDYEQNILSLIEQRENINFRETMQTVFREGSVYLNNISEDVKESINSQLENVKEEYRSKEVYLLFSKKAFAKNQEDGKYDTMLKSKYNDCENVGAALMMSLHRVRPEKHHESVEDFLEESLKILPEEKRQEAQVYAISAQVGEFEAYPKPSKVQDENKPDQYDRHLKQMKSLETGEIDTLEIAIDSLVGKEISLNKLLSSLPLTAFIDQELTDREKVIMSQNYQNYKSDDIHKDIEIDNLFAWASLSEEQIISILKEYSDGEINEKRWEEIGSELYDVSQRINRASSGFIS